MSPIPNPQKSILVALGLTSMTSCGLFDKNTDSGDTEDSGEIVVGPCLSQDPPLDSGIDTAVGPCLTQEPPDTGDTGDEENGNDSGEESDENKSVPSSKKITNLRNDFIQNFIETGVLPANFAKKTND